MSTRKFKADVAAATEKVQAGLSRGISAISRGDSDGEVVLTYHHAGLSSPVRIQVLAQELSEYPDGNNFLAFTDSPDVPQALVDAIVQSHEVLISVKVDKMITILTTLLDKSLSPARSASGASDKSMELADGGGYSDEEDTFMGGVEESDDEDEDDEDGYCYYEDDDDAFGLSAAKNLPAKPSLHSAANSSEATPQNFRQRVSADLWEARKAGFKVGLLGGFGRDVGYGILSLSIRVEKLSLSLEAMKAWGLSDPDYLVLLINYNDGYAPFERLATANASAPKPAFGISYRLGRCSRYKPSLASAKAAFQNPRIRDASRDSAKSPRHDASQDVDDEAFEKLFISPSLNQFMDESLVALLALRESTTLHWEAANEELNTRLGLPSGTSPSQSIDAAEGGAEADAPFEGHKILEGDHLIEGDPDRRSFPLVAMQFAIHYLVKCTEYCLRCHRRVVNDFGALRPYVCSNPLCLFQYMTMGFGPSIEHAILGQPSVVDLLVSLFYASLSPDASCTRGPDAASKSLIREFPLGLKFMVPSFDPQGDAKPPIRAVRREQEAEDVNDPIMVGALCELVLQEPRWDSTHRLAIKQWVAVRHYSEKIIDTIQQPAKTYHGVITSIDRGSLAYTLQVMATSGLEKDKDGDGEQSKDSDADTDTPLGRDILIYPYELDFGMLRDGDKALAIQHVLDTMPPVETMREYVAAHLTESFQSMPSISPAAASLLRWIISSNRSYIEEVISSSPSPSPSSSRSATPEPPPRPISTALCCSDDPYPYPNPGPDPDPEDSRRPKAKAKAEFRPASPKEEARRQSRSSIARMDGWVQFRFTQGSPDKEVRFNKALREVHARRRISAYPTLLAWHGSRLGNWHSILRTGLDFKTILSGRAYGDGVYFSKNLTTSVGYLGHASRPWPNSSLRISAATSLNEIVNAPDEFKSRNPHYVVQHLDWQQCRYLFVRSAARDANATKAPLREHRFRQEPGAEVLNERGDPILIPQLAMPRRNISGETASSSFAHRSIRSTTRSRDDEDSDEEDAQDLEFLDSNRHMASQGDSSSGKDPAKPYLLDPAATDFHPALVDLQTIPYLNPPDWATGTALRLMSREVKRLQALQASTPLHELGWYMDFDSMTNLFHWVVQFHSFEPSLPLAKDMRKHKIPSIIFEIRFGREYPMSPPFVRVVRPRFLSFARGGGGHITAGGAMCMELLTGTGWSPANDMESVLLQVRLALCNMEPMPARLVPDPFGEKAGRPLDYSMSEAMAAFERVARAHGWAMPKDNHSLLLDYEVATQGQSPGPEEAASQLNW